MFASLASHLRTMWRFWSMKAAVLLVVLQAIQITGDAFEANSAFNLWTHAGWWIAIKSVVIAAIPILRVIPQPVGDAPAVAEPAAPEPMPSPDTAFGLALEKLFSTHLKDVSMNTNITNILQAIPGLVIQAEQAFKGAPGSGADKAAAVTSIVAQTLPVGDSVGMQKAQAIMTMAVAFFDMFHPLFQKSSGAQVQQVLQQPSQG